MCLNVAFIVINVIIWKYSFQAICDGAYRAALTSRISFYSLILFLLISFFLKIFCKNLRFLSPGLLRWFSRLRNLHTKPDNLRSISWAHSRREPTPASYPLTQVLWPPPPMKKQIFKKLLFSFVYFKMILNPRKKIIQNSLSILK